MNKSIVNHNIDVGDFLLKYVKNLLHLMQAFTFSQHSKILNYFCLVIHIVFIIIYNDCVWHSDYFMTI